MSENKVVTPSLAEAVTSSVAEVPEKDSIIITEEDASGVNMSENAIAPKSIAVVDVEDDLEDGEIDDDDDNDEPIVVIDSKSVGTAPPPSPVANALNKASPQSLPAKNMMVMDMINDMGKKPKTKSSKHQVVEDDFAGSIERSIAAALKKDGIMPPMPKILEAREESEKKCDKESSLSKSSRRRKRRKLRDDREKEKEKKKHRSSTPEPTVAVAIEEELDDDEMLCVRGGSPPPAGIFPILPSLDPSTSSKKDVYDSDDSYTSYDSYDSAPTYQRYSSSRKKDSSVGGSSSSRSKRKERSRRDDDRRSEKRNRRNYDDSGGEDKYQDRHPQQPRKLELCKFYLMECCAKKEKCSYMHSDFPCKYYYLGMECVYRAACKFSHGKPLSDQLRNVLLKHLETAPKEILGTFRRISRENALNLMMTTHDKICQEHGIENTMAPPAITTQSVVHTQAGTRNSEHAQQQQLTQQQQLGEVIPSLLDMVIKGPPNPSDSQGTTSSTTVGTALNPNKPEKQRKSRWCDSTTTTPVITSSAIVKLQTNLEPPSSSAPSYLDLKNLTGILSTDRIEKLSKFGVVNLEQINQLTLSQLNNIGLTINEISEIQLNARNMARLGVGGVGIHGDVVASNANPLITTTTALNTSSGSLPSCQDVDMRFLPSCLPLTTTTITTSTVSSDKSMIDIGLSSLDPPQSKPRGSPIHPTLSGSNPSDTHGGSSNVSGIDYSQYLKDSNLGYDKNDTLDDEKDEEQLVIDDQDLDGLDDSSQTRDPEMKDGSDNESKVSYGYGGIDTSIDQRLPTQVSTKSQVNLKDPYKATMPEIFNSKENLNDKINKSLDSKFYSKHYNDNDDNDNGDCFYGMNIKVKSQSYRDIDSREDYRDPRQREPTREEYRDPRYHHNPPEPKDEYRDPRLTSSSRSSAKEKKSHSTISYKTNIRSDDDSDRDRSRSRSQSRSRSRSHSPISSVSHHHRNQLEQFQPIYERPSIYDWHPKCLQEDQEYSRRNTKADKDMRLAGFLDSSNSDIDLRLPFQPVKNIQIAKEIDGSMSTLMPITYKVYELDIPDPKYSDLRQSFQSEDTADPRLRRILGLPELSNSKALAALGRPSRPTIASPSSVESSSSPTRSERDRLSAPIVAVTRGPRVDPRRAAAAAAASASASASSTSVSFQAQVNQLPAGNPQQNIEIRLLLQKSDWYKNLNSKAKIMVNQQLALVSTELKRYHQDPSPNKVFDIQFILNNQNLQEILTCLGIYIDDNGQVAHVDNDHDDNMMMAGGCGMNMGMGPGPGPGPAMDYGGGVNPMMMMNDPSMNVQQRMAMQGQMEFLRGPPPNINNMIGPMGTGGGGGQGMYVGPGNMMPPYGRNPRIGMGMSQGNGGVGFNPFAGNPGDNNGGGGGNGGMIDSNYCGSNNPFSNSFAPNGGNFNNQQMNRGNRNQNRQGGGIMNNGSMRNQNRRFKQNRRGGGGGSNGGGGNSGGDVNMGKSGSGGGVDTHDQPSIAITAASNTSAGDDVEESWDD